jgi:CubicO group peptidase (beta-lactamase class C family)
LYRDAEVRSRRADEPLTAASEARDAYAGKLLPNVQLRLFRDTQWMFATRTIARGTTVQELPRADIQLQDLVLRSKGVEFDLTDYLSRNRVASLLLLKRGRIAFEHYDLGTDANTRWISMSMAKSVSTTLVGAAIQDKFIGGVDEQLTRYLPELRGTSYEGVSIRHLLQMTSGVHWDDTHTDPASERRQMLELQIAQQPGSIMKYLATQPRVAPPGTIWNYSTGETHVVGALIRAAVGGWCADYLSQKIWSKVGMQSDATWWLEAPNGLEVAGSGINATLRDYARFGLFVANGGVIGNERVLPEGWLAEATAPRQVGNTRVDYGYMWWPVPSSNGSFADGAFTARGIFGQYIYINPREQVVAVVLSARSKPKGAEAIPDNDFFNSAVTALK